MAASLGWGAKQQAGAERLPNPRYLFALSCAIILCLMASVIWSALYAAHRVDEAAVGAERERAAVALSVTLAEGARPDAALAFRMASEFLLAEARFTAPGAVVDGEAAVPVPGHAETILAWQPHRLGSEMVFSLAPMRVLISVIFLGAIGLILARLYRLARELERRQKLAEELAGHDALTGLANRLAFDTRLAEVFASGAGVGLLYIDLDEFKNVNDSKGHAAGDALLRQVAARLRRFGGPDDLVARIGGDEFAILRASGLKRRDLAELAADIRIALGEPCHTAQGTIAIGASIGVAMAPEHAGSASALVEAADSALYRAKARSEGYSFAEDGEPGQAATGAR